MLLVLIFGSDPPCLQSRGSLILQATDAEERRTGSGDEVELIVTPRAVRFPGHE
jgi:hypothetical protein